MAFHKININSTDFELAPQKVKPYTSSSNTNYPIPFLEGLGASTGLTGRTVYTDTTNTFHYNPSTDTLTTGKIKGTLDGKIKVKSVAGDTTYYVTFIKNPLMGSELCVDANSLKYNPNTNILTTGSIKVIGSASSTATIKADAATNMYVDIGGNIPLVIKYDSIDKFIACGSSFSKLVNLGTSARQWANVYATTFHGALSGNATTATNATNATNVNVTTSSTSSNYPLVFTSSVTAGNKRLYTDTVNSLYYNPKTNLLKIDSGKVEATNGFYETSDERLKDFQEDIEVNFSYLHNIPKKYYSWKDDTTYTRHIGTSAQEVQKYYPELVNTDETGYLTMNYDKLSVVALKAIDVLHEEVTELKKENTELKERLARLEELILNK